MVFGFFIDGFYQKCHQRIHFILGAIPILDRECVEREIFDAEFASRLDDRARRLRAFQRRPDITWRRRIHNYLTTTDAEWVSAAYSLTFASFLILWGRIADRVGRRLLFVVGVIFGVGAHRTGRMARFQVAHAAMSAMAYGALLVSL